MKLTNITLQIKENKITIEQAQKALETIKDFEGIDPAYLSAELAGAYEILEIFLTQIKGV